jgi:hypothetical protein
VKLNFSVARLPVTFGSDGSVHLAFDLPHWLLRLVDELIVAGQGARSRGVVPVPQLSHQTQVEGFVQDSIILH